jgi:hypothetical protein
MSASTICTTKVMTPQQQQQRRQRRRQQCLRQVLNRRCQSALKLSRRSKYRILKRRERSRQRLLIQPPNIFPPGAAGSRAAADAAKWLTVQVPATCNCSMELPSSPHPFLFPFHWIKSTKIPVFRNFPGLFSGIDLLLIVQACAVDLFSKAPLSDVVRLQVAAATLLVDIIAQLLARCTPFQTPAQCKK